MVIAYMKKVMKEIQLVSWRVTSLCHLTIHKQIIGKKSVSQVNRNFWVFFFLSFQIFRLISQLGYKFPEADLGFNHPVPSILNFHVNLPKILLLHPSGTFMFLISTLNLRFKAACCRDKIIWLWNNRHMFFLLPCKRYQVCSNIKPSHMWYCDL